LNSRNNEVCILLDQQCKLEEDITKKIQELGLIKEELGAMNTSVVQAVEERDSLCKQIEDWKSKVMSLEATVVEQANEINRISSELHSEQALVKEHKLAADKARQVTWVLRMCALTLSCFDFHRCAYCGTCTHTFQRLQIV
jgi:septal ring factor EnvC (AmiA/AmiB activator)